MNKLEIKSGETYFLNEFMKLVAQKANFTEGDVRIVYDAFVETIFEACVADAKIHLSGLINIGMTKIKAHTGWNNFTKERIEIPEKRHIVFHVGKTFYHKVLRAAGMEEDSVELEEDELI